MEFHPEITTPSLPLELQREIFETAIRSNHRNAVLKLNLSLVAHYVHFWVDSVFYELVTICGGPSANRSLKLVDLKPRGFFATAVNTLLLSNTTDVQALATLSVCTGVQFLAVWNHSVLQRDSLLQVSQLSLRRLSTAFENIINIVTVAAPPTWLENLTHLRSYFYLQATASDLGHLHQFPCLTHVALYVFETNLSHAKTVCSSCPDLQVLAIITGDGTPPDDTIEAYSFDPRIVVKPSPPESIKDWEAAYFGLPDMWTSADRVLAEWKALVGLQSMDNVA